MRALLHLISVILILPVLGFAAAFSILGHVIAAGSLLRMFLQVIDDAAWIMPWGLLGAAFILLVITLGGFLARTRWLAGLCVAILGVVSTGLVLLLTWRNAGFTLDQVPFFVPGLLGAGIGTWFAFIERESVSGGTPAPAAPSG